MNSFDPENQIRHQLDEEVASTSKEQPHEQQRYQLDVEIASTSKEQPQKRKCEGDELEGTKKKRIIREFLFTEYRFVCVCGASLPDRRALIDHKNAAQDPRIQKLMAELIQGEPELAGYEWQHTPTADKLVAVLKDESGPPMRGTIKGMLKTTTNDLMKYYEVQKNLIAMMRFV
jgi:hypothetical protein